MGIVLSEWLDMDKVSEVRWPLKKTTVLKGCSMKSYSLNCRTDTSLTNLHVQGTGTEDANAGELVEVGQGGPADLPHYQVAS